MRLFIQAYRVRVVSFRVRSTPRRPQQNRKESGGRAAPDALRGRRPSKWSEMVRSTFREEPKMVRSNLKLNAAISDSKIGGLRIMLAEDQTWGGSKINGINNAFVGHEPLILKPHSLTK